MKSTDRTPCRTFVNWKLQLQLGFSWKIIFKDGDDFTLDVFENKQIWRIWKEYNLQAILEISWAGGDMGPFLFEYLHERVVSSI